MLALFFRRSRVIEPTDQWVLSQAPKKCRRSAAMQSTDIHKPVICCFDLLVFGAHRLPKGSTARCVKKLSPGAPESHFRLSLAGEASRFHRLTSSTHFVTCPSPRGTTPWQFPGSGDRKSTRLNSSHSQIS